MDFSEQHLILTVNGRKYEKIVVCDHYRANHVDHISEELIIELVKCLSGEKRLPEDKDDDGIL